MHNALAGRDARHAAVPYVLAPRGAYDPYIVKRHALMKKAWWFTAEHRLLQHARGVHVFFESQRADIEKLGYHGPLVVAPNGVDPPGVTWDGGSGGYLLWLGRFDPEHKGLDLLLKAVKLIPRAERIPLRIQGPDWRDRKREVRRMVRDLELDDTVTVGEPLYGDLKWEALRRALGFVYPSRWEAFGNSPAEAISIGLPTLVTPYPLGRGLADRGGAILVEASTEAIAEGLRRLVVPDAARIGREGARILRDEFDWGTVARAWSTQLEALL
jgi:glycosyltransferase involved in cell wall biosynthesis